MMIRGINVGKHYPGKRTVLLGLDFAIERGDLAFLTGPSGAGKTTLLKLIARLESLSRGSLFVNDIDVGKLPRGKVPAFRRTMGIVLQDPHLLFDRDVAANVALALKVAGISRRQAESRVRAALDKVGLTGRGSDDPQYLSAGEQQRVGIARAIVHSPGLIIADEPTGNLDPALSTEIMDLFLDFSRHGATVLIATHDIQQVERLDAPVLKLKAGRLQEPT